MCGFLYGIGPNGIETFSIAASLVCQPYPFFEYNKDPWKGTTTIRAKTAKSRLQKWQAAQLHCATCRFWSKVVLLSGKTATVKAGLDDEVRVLKCQAEIALGVGKGRLTDSSGNFLDAQTLIRDARIKNGASLTLHINTAQVRSSRGAFASILGDGSVVTWGDDRCGGDSSDVQDQLRNAQQIQVTSRAFAAILGNGSVVTWGDARHGGDNSTVQHKLKNVQHIQATRSALRLFFAMDRS